MLGFHNLKKLTIIETIVFIILLGGIIAGVFAIHKSEGFEDMIDKDEKKFDDALEKRIDEAKQTTRFDAEVLISENKPYKQDSDDRSGWWSEAINGSVIPTIYSRAKESWIWPY